VSNAGAEGVMRGVYVRSLCKEYMRRVYERRGVCDERTQGVSASVCEECMSEGVYARSGCEGSMQVYARSV
jgi:hypothetical protein